ncbi:MAG: hypothetical protein M5U28_10020 [Sandaracinaceae bacterium]|nr:hypothetical protein [Sandaracinaceae bacterium]
MAAIAAMYVNAGVQKLLVSGIGWADGDSLRMLVLTQRPLGPSLTGAIADAVVNSRALAFSLAAFTELAQLSAITYPFLPRARPIVGSMLLAFHAGVLVLTPIAFPQSMALLVAFSYPWRRLLARGGEAREVVLARAPARGAAAIASAAALLAGLALLPPVQEALEPLSHRHDTRHAARVGPPREPPRPTFDARAAAALGIDGPGARVAGCEARAVTSSGDDVHGEPGVPGRGARRGDRPGRQPPPLRAAKHRGSRPLLPLRVHHERGAPRRPPRGARSAERADGAVRPRLRYGSRVRPARDDGEIPRDPAAEAR